MPSIVLYALILWLGVLIGFLLKSFLNKKFEQTIEYDGDMVVTYLEGGRKNYHLDLQRDPEIMDQRESITFRVVRK